MTKKQENDPETAPTHASWWKRQAVRIAQLDQHLQGDRWRWFIRLFYKLMAPFYDWGTHLLMPDYTAATAHLADVLQLGAEDIVLDLGCGTGMVTQPARARAPFTVGIDMTPAMLRQLQKQQRGGRPFLIRGDVRHLPLVAGACSAVTSSFMLLHLNEREKQQVFAATARVLRPGGRLALLTCRHEIGDAYPTPAQWRSWLSAAGFATAEVIPYRDVYHVVTAHRPGPT